MADSLPLPGGDEPELDLEGLLSPLRSSRAPADPRADPSEDEWTLLDFLRSQHEEMALSLTPQEQAAQDRRTTALREALHGIGFPVHDRRALHTALLTSVTIYQMTGQAAAASRCPAAMHAFAVHEQDVYRDLSLMIRELLKDAGVRSPRTPSPTDAAPTSDPDTPGLTWQELTTKPPEDSP